MYLPIYAKCTVCHERFDVPFRGTYYYVGDTPLAGQVRDADLLEALLHPAWCKDCDMMSLVEDIMPLRDFENSLGAVRAGLETEYPVDYSPSPVSESSKSEYAQLWR